MAGELDGQVAIVTGSVRRIGRAIALKLAAGGAAIVVNAKSSADEAEAVRREIEELGGRALVRLADVADERAVQGMAEDALAAFGRIDILVNNAAIRRDDPFMTLDLAAWRQVTSIILDGAFNCCRAVMPAMLAAGYGRIVNIGGVSAHLGAPNRAHVIAAKTGLVGLTRALATEFAQAGITVNCVVPGQIGGPRSASSGTGSHGETRVGRKGTVEEVADAVVFLARPDSAFITGQSLHVSGGMFMP
jgi:3-oxoacyl-[acyl-carrier protein] reductase